MSIDVLLPALTSLLALIFAIALLDQWLERRHGFQLIWAAGMLFFAIASACEAVGAAAGWGESLFRVWYLTGGVLTAAWLGLGTAYLLGRTRFGYAYAALVLLGGLIAFGVAPKYGAQTLGVLILIGALVAAISIAVETYFQNERWPIIAAITVVAASILGAFFAFSDPLNGPLPMSGAIPAVSAMSGPGRAVSVFLNVPGAVALILGALFSTYIFMPKKRVLDYSLDAGQKGDEFLFNVFLAVFAIPVNFVASLPRTLKALFTGHIHSRVPATLLIALGGLVIGSADSLFALGSTAGYSAAKLVGLVLIFVGFLVSTEVFREIRIPFTTRVLRGNRHEPQTATPATDSAR